jgi:hypothetical protein
LYIAVSLSVEPDASLLNESDNEDQTKTKTDNNDSSVVILDDDNDVQIEKIETTPSKPTATSESSETKTELPGSEVKPKCDEDDEVVMVEDSEKLEVKVDTPSGPSTKEDESKEKEVPGSMKKAVEVEDVDSDYEVMEISLDEIKPSVKPDASRSVSTSSKGDVNEDYKDGTSRKRAVPSSDADEIALAGSSVKRTKLETESKVEQSSRASTPDSVVCLPYATPTKDEIKPVCEGNKKLITDQVNFVIVFIL